MERSGLRRRGIPILRRKSRGTKQQTPTLLGRRLLGPPRSRRCRPAQTVRSSRTSSAPRSPPTFSRERARLQRWPAQRQTAAHRMNRNSLLHRGSQHRTRDRSSSAHREAMDSAIAFPRECPMDIEKRGCLDGSPCMTGHRVGVRASIGLESRASSRRPIPPHGSMRRLGPTNSRGRSASEESLCLLSGSSGRAP